MAQLSCVSEAVVDPLPSLGYNTLAISDVDGCKAYVHDEDVLVLRGGNAVRLTQNEANKASITSLRFVKPFGRSLLAFTNRYGVTLFDVSRDCAIVRISPPQDFEPRGVACGAFEGQERLFVGSSAGAVGVYALSQDFEATLVNTVSGHSAAVTTVAAAEVLHQGPCLATCDNEGTVCISNGDGVTISHNAFPGDCATSVAWLPSALVVGFGSGTIRLLDRESALLKVAIGAHSRWINAIAVSQDRFASVAEDGLVAVWTVQGESVLLHGSAAHPDSLLCGCGFAPDQSSLTVIAFDTSKCWTHGL